MVITGLDQFLKAPSVRGPVGLLTNTASQSADGRVAFRALREAGVEISVIFSVEHGYFGIGSAGESIPDDQHNMIPILSLYNFQAQAPLEQALSPLSAVLIDLQDVGLRWYTFLATMFTMLRECAALQKPIIILDRPNPLGGLLVEGPLAEPAYFSMVAPAAVPVRYGLTLGELALWFNQVESLGLKIEVVPLRGWKREMVFADTNLRWLSPSPNMPHAWTTLIYAGTCLVEAVNLSEGRGTALPFEQFGAPFINGEKLADALNALQLPGLAFNPAWFRPNTSKYAGERCQGVRISVTEPRQVSGFAMGLYMLQTLWRLFPTSMQWIGDATPRWIDKLTGSTRIRAAVDSGQEVTTILKFCNQESAAFQAQTKAFYLYD